MTLKTLQIDIPTVIVWKHDGIYQCWIEPLLTASLGRTIDELVNNTVSAVRTIVDFVKEEPHNIGDNLVCSVLFIKRVSKMSDDEIVRELGMDQHGIKNCMALGNMINYELDNGSIEKFEHRLGFKKWIHPSFTVVNGADNNLKNHDMSPYIIYRIDSMIGGVLEYLEKEVTGE